MIGIFYKTVFDISVFYTFAGFFFCYAIGYETNPLSYGVFLIAALVLAVSGGMKYNGKTVAVIAAVIPAFTLLIETTTVGRAEVILLWAYFIFMINRETYLIYYYHFMEKFKGFVTALILPVIFFFFDLEKGMAAANLSIPYLLVFLAAGVMTLQSARHRAAADSRKQFVRFQIVQSVLFFAVCILLTVSNVLQTLMNGIIVPLVSKTALFLTNTVFGVIADLFQLAPEELEFSFDMEGFQEAKKQGEAVEKFSENNAWQNMINSVSDEAEKADLTEVFLYAGIVLAVIVLIALVGKATKHSRVVGLNVEREDLPEQEEPKKTVRKNFFDPEKIIRGQYREFMKKAETKEYTLEKSDTTKQILEKYNTKMASVPEAAEQLTNLYRNIRYGEKTADKADAAAMKRLVKKS